MSFYCRFCRATIPKGLHHTCQKCGHPFEECARCGTLGKRDNSPCESCGANPLPVRVLIGAAIVGVLTLPLLILLLPIVLVARLVALPFIGLENLRKRGGRLGQTIDVLVYVVETIFNSVIALIFFVLVLLIVIAFYGFIVFLFLNPGGKPPWA